MSVAIPRRAVAELSRASDYKQTVADRFGGLLEKIEVMHNMLLVAIYIRPEKIGNIIRPDENIAEDVFQGKVGLVLKKGPNAFVDDDVNKFFGQNVEAGDWVGFRVGDTWPFSLRDVPCRLVADTNIKLKLDDPSVIF